MKPHRRREVRRQVLSAYHDGSASHEAARQAIEAATDDHRTPTRIAPSLPPVVHRSTRTWIVLDWLALAALALLVFGTLLAEACEVAL